MNAKSSLISKFNALKKKDLSQHNDLLDSANYISQIFLDQDSLFDQVNKEYRYQLSFKYPKFKQGLKINGEVVQPIATIARIGDLRDRDIQTYNRKQFFKATAYRYGDQDQSIHDLVKFYRHTGGAHPNPTKEEHKNLKILTESVYLNEQPIEGYDSIMKRVTEAVIEALEPFIREIQLNVKTEEK